MDKFLPVGDQVLVELLFEDKSEGGLVLPDKTVKYGKLKAIGLGVDAKYLGIFNKEKNSRGIAINDKVLLPRGDQGYKVSDTLRLMSASYIAAVIE